MSKQPVDPAKMPQILWSTQILSVLIMTALAWGLPELIPIEPIAGVPVPLLIVAIASIPVVFLVARLLGFGATREDIHTHNARPDGHDGANADDKTKLARYLVVLALAEMPAIFAIVYVFVGGNRTHAIALGAAALAMMLTFTPRKAGIGTGPP